MMSDYELVHSFTDTKIRWSASAGYMFKPEARVMQPGRKGFVLSIDDDHTDKFTLNEVLTFDDNGEPEITVSRLSSWGTSFHAFSPSRCDDPNYFMTTVNAIIAERTK